MTVGDAGPVDHDVPIRPDSYYGVNKVACEGLTKYYVDFHGIEVVNVRISWYMTEDDLRSTTGDDADPGTDGFVQSTWLSPQDCRDVNWKAVTATYWRVVPRSTPSLGTTNGSIH